MWRLYTDSNTSVMTKWTYAIETAFHEALLQVTKMPL